MIKPSLMSLMIVSALLLAGCNHHTKAQDTKAVETQFEQALNDYGSLRWKCPGPAYMRQNPDGSTDNWASCAVEVGKVTVYINRGAIVPLGDLISSEGIAPKTFDSHTQGETFMSEILKHVSYSVPHDPSTIRVGYEVTFAACDADAFTLYVKDNDEDGALAALEYAFNTMKHSSYCNL